MHSRVLFEFELIDDAVVLKELGNPDGAAVRLGVRNPPGFLRF
jgi:hypothetical protein